tara:strand:+ start:1073 stop:1945 length:873 start_codon:yes stop_codon:yes gene_type:complete
MINVIQKLINFQIGFLTPTFFSAITNALGITGDVPAGTTSRVGYFSPRVQISGPLFTGQYDAKRDGTIKATSYLTDEGRDIEKVLRRQFSDKELALQEYTQGGDQAQIDREIELMNKMAAPGELLGRRALEEEAIARTGGLFTTPGMQQAFANYEQNIARDMFERQLMATDRSRAERRLLESEEIGSLQSIVNYLNQPLQVAQQALATGAATAPGNMQSAQMIANNELLNRAASMNFMNMLMTAGTATKSPPNSTSFSGRSSHFMGQDYGQQSQGSGSPSFFSSFRNIFD